MFFVVLPLSHVHVETGRYTGAYATTMSREALAEWHRPRFELLCDRSPCDVLAFETIPCLSEVQAILDVLKTRPKAKAWISMACSSGTQLTSGESVEECVQQIEALDVTGQVEGVGVNCTRSEYVNELCGVIRRGTDRTIVVYPNSGEDWDSVGKVWKRDSTSSGSDQTTNSGPEAISVCAAEWIKISGGKNIAIGGCCRIGPEHIKHLSDTFSCQPVTE